MIKIKYFLNNVDQCWTCNNCVGSSPLMSFPHLDKHINGMIEYDEGDKDEYYCIDKIVEKLKEFDWCLIKPPANLNIPPHRRCWGLCKKEEPVTKLPRYE